MKIGETAEIEVRAPADATFAVIGLTRLFASDNGTRVSLKKRLAYVQFRAERDRPA